MSKTKLSPAGIIALLASIAYIIVKVDYDIAWYGYIDDFFVFMAGYTFFMSTRYKNANIKRTLKLLSGVLFIFGMMTLIALILFL